MAGKQPPQSRKPLTKKERKEKVKKLFEDAPHTNGRMNFIKKHITQIAEDGTETVVDNPNFDQTKINTIKTKLKEIKDLHVPTIEQPVADLFYLVSEFNKVNVGQEINGDTASEILAEEPQPEVGE